MARKTVRRCCALFVLTKPDGHHDAIENLAVVDPDHIVAALDANGFHDVGHHHAHFGIRRANRRANRIGVELGELAKTARAGFFIAPDRTGRIAPIGLWQGIIIGAT